MKSNRILVIGSLILTLSMLTSCFPTVKKLCSHDFIILNHSLEEAQIYLLNLDNRDWQGWSEDRLKEVENHMDLVGAESKYKRIRPLLSEIANLWVEFYGFAEFKQFHKMSLTLEKIQKYQLKIEESVCR